jgi:hypothetical protein
VFKWWNIHHTIVRTLAILSLKLHEARICSHRLVFFVSHIVYLEYFVLRVFFFVMEGMEVSGGTRDDGDQDASLSLQTITTGAATDDPASPSSASRQFDCDDEEDDEEESGTTSTHVSQHGRVTRKRQRSDFPWSYTHDWVAGASASY